MSWRTATPSLKANVWGQLAAMAGSSRVRGGVNVCSPIPLASSSGGRLGQNNRATGRGSSTQPLEWVEVRTSGEEHCSVLARWLSSKGSPGGKRTGQRKSSDDAVADGHFVPSEPSPPPARPTGRWHQVVLKAICSQSPRLSTGPWSFALGLYRKKPKPGKSKQRQTPETLSSSAALRLPGDRTTVEQLAFVQAPCSSEELSTGASGSPGKFRMGRVRQLIRVAHRCVRTRSERSPPVSSHLPWLARQSSVGGDPLSDLAVAGPDFHLAASASTRPR